VEPILQSSEKNEALREKSPQSRDSNLKRIPS